MSDSAPPRTIRIVTLGCAKNDVDSEEIAGTLIRRGYVIDPVTVRPDVVIINTCGFLKVARVESVAAIRDAVRLKKSNKHTKVIVAGCLAQRHGRALEAEAPGADAYIGVGQMARFGEIVDVALAGGASAYHEIRAPQHLWSDVDSRARSGAPWSAYLKLSEGCDHKCTFCTIPSFRGPHRSKPIERIEQEASFLARTGARELNLVAQDVTQYGFDLYGRSMLPDLLRRLDEVANIEWIRLLYVYPNRLTPEVIESIARLRAVLPYVDIPLQHVHPDILRSMRRPWDGERYLKLFEMLRAAVPSCAIRTTFIVGFPGETAAHFQYMIDWLNAARLDRVGAFTYSRELGTPSYSFPNQVPLHVKRARYDRLMSTQQPISLAINQALVGEPIDVLVERAADPSRGNPRSAGRSYRDAPDIDGEVYIEGSFRPGSIIPAVVTSANEYDLFATPCGEVPVRETTKKRRFIPIEVRP